MRLCTLGHSIKAVVAAPVMEYIKGRHSADLNKMIGGHILTEEQYSTETDSIALIFKPRSSRVTESRVRLVRERFVTFYQKIASNLHVMTVNIRQDRCRDLHRRFPELVFDPQPSGVRVIGSYADIGLLQDFIQQKSSGSRDGQTRRMHEAPMHFTNNHFHSSSTASCEQSDGKETCVICMEVIPKAVKETLDCKHSFCKGCLKEAFVHKPVCPICGALYGTLKGTQPEGGTMSCSYQNYSLPGYEAFGTITVHYNIPSGIQKVRIQSTECLFNTMCS